MLVVHPIIVVVVIITLVGGWIRAPIAQLLLLHVTSSNLTIHLDDLVVQVLF